MVSVLLLAGVVILFLISAYKYMFFREHNFPPGPPRIPLFGSYLFLLMLNPKLLYKSAILCSKFYKSKIIGLYLGDFPTVVANSHEGAKEILTRQEFDGRPDVFAGRLRHPNFEKLGIFFVDGPLWKDQRRFVLRYLRDFGFGRRFTELETAIQEEISDMIDLVKNGPKYPHEKELVCGNKALCPNFMTNFAVNCFFHMVFNERIPRSEQESLIKLTKSGMLFQRSGDDYGRLLSMLPWIVNIFPQMSGYTPLRTSSMDIYKFIKAMVDKNYDTFDERFERNFLDIYFKEMKKEQAKGGPTTFLYDHLILSIVDFTIPALTAVASQVSVIIQFFLIKPEILKNVQKEIDEIVGQGRLPTLDDRPNLHITEATIREIARFETLVPSSIPHTALVDTELQGYSIPKGTIVVASLYALHNDKDVWGDPENFRPERFLDENGKLSLKNDFSLPFGAGKRVCAGETFARNMIFLLVASLCQNFNFILPPGVNPPDLKKNLTGIIVTPPDFWVDLTVR